MGGISSSATQARRGSVWVEMSAASVLILVVDYGTLTNTMAQLGHTHGGGGNEAFGYHAMSE